MNEPIRPRSGYRLQYIRQKKQTVRYLRIAPFGRAYQNSTKIRNQLLTVRSNINTAEILLAQAEYPITSRQARTLTNIKALYNKIVDRYEKKGEAGGLSIVKILVASEQIVNFAQENWAQWKKEQNK